jgi:hypothetical protein
MNVTFRVNAIIKSNQTRIVAGTKATAKFIKVPSKAYPDVLRYFIEVTIPEGTETAAGSVLESDLTLKTSRFTMFFKPPTLKTMEKWNSDSVAKSVTGGRCEPDGHSADGAPSWLLALGYI